MYLPWHPSISPQICDVLQHEANSRSQLRIVLIHLHPFKVLVHPQLKAHQDLSK